MEFLLKELQKFEQVSSCLLDRCLVCNIYIYISIYLSINIYIYIHIYMYIRYIDIDINI